MRCWILIARSWAPCLALAVLACTLLAGEGGAQSSQGSSYTFHALSDLVLVNVTVRDREGNLLRDLKPTDFILLEDNKPQHVTSFDIQNVEMAVPAAVQQAALLGALKSGSTAQRTPYRGMRRPSKTTG